MNETHSTKGLGQVIQIDEAKVQEHLGAIVRGIIKDHGGQICVEGEVGQGAIFVITLPRPKETPQIQSAAEVLPKAV